MVDGNIVGVMRCNLVSEAETNVKAGLAKERVLNDGL